MTLLDTGTHTSTPAPLVALERLLWVGPLTVLTSVASVHVVRLLALSLPGVRGDSVAMGWIAPTADTVILVGLGVLAFPVISAFDDDPVRKYRWVAFGALLVSFLPLLIMAGGGLIGNRSTAAALVAMHVAAYVPCVTLMLRLTTISARDHAQMETA